MRIMGHSSVTVSQRYVHPTPETMETAFLSLERAAEGAEKRCEGLDVTTVLTTLPEAAGGRIQ
jgi:hypothetical protein